LSAQDAVGLLTQGLKGGAFNADKVADSLKELTIRVKDLGDKNAGEALKKIGLGHEDMARKFAEGGPAAREGLQQILNGLRGVEDPAARAQLAVALFGTQAEDMAGALASLDLSTAAQQLGGIEGAAGAADRALATMSDNTSTKIESAKRNIEVAMDGIKGALAEAFGDEISGVADWVSK
jgi:TP901 family phage tail tape measure protein